MSQLYYDAPFSARGHSVNNPNWSPDAIAATQAQHPQMAATVHAAAKAVSQTTAVPTKPPTGDTANTSATVPTPADATTKNAPAEPTQGPVGTVTLSGAGQISPVQPNYGQPAPVYNPQYHPEATQHFITNNMGGGTMSPLATSVPTIDTSSVLETPQYSASGVPESVQFAPGPVMPSAGRAKGAPTIIAKSGSPAPIRGRPIQPQMNPSEASAGPSPTAANLSNTFQSPSYTATGIQPISSQQTFLQLQDPALAQTTQQGLAQLAR